MIKHQPSSWFIFPLLIALLLTACSPGSAIQPVNDSRIINNGSSFGQSFTAQNDGLSGISVLLAPSISSGSGSLFFHLRSNPQSQDDLAVARLALSEITHQAYYKFDFPSQSDSQRKDYFLQVDFEGDGQIQIFTSTADSYLDGALYENQIPQEAQLGFRLEYDRNAYLLGLIKLAVEWCYVLVVGLFVFILPGWVLFKLLWRGWNDLNLMVKLGLSGGLSLAIYPLLLLWTDLVGLHLGPLYAWLPPVIGLLVLIWLNRQYFIQIRSLWNKIIDFFRNYKIPPIDIAGANLAFVVILSLMILSRLWVIRSLDIPLFGDSYQHTLITQLIIDHGGLFKSWEPYTDLTTFTYHFGFHSTAAVFHWITGTSAIKAVLWTGQLVNILAILGVYPLAFKITKNRWAGVIAILVAGLLSPMPMSYVNWGRYTQLAGQVILPTLIWTTWSLLERLIQNSPNISWIRKVSNWKYLSFDLGSLTIAWLAFGGLALTHYRVSILFILFFLAYIIFAFSRTNFINLLGRIAWICIGGAILFAPWFIHVFGGRMPEIFSIQVTTPSSTIISTSDQLTKSGDISSYLPMSIWILLLVCMCWGLWKHKLDLAIFVLWWFIIILATNPLWLGLPGTGVITNFAMLISFYIPASVVVGSAIDWIPHINRQSVDIDKATKRSKLTRFIFPSLMLLIICGLGLWGIRVRVRDLNIPAYSLVTKPDLRAMEWIRDHTDTDATFLVNSFFAYNDTLVAGSDGGWWIPLLAGRKSSLPPLTYGIEEGIGIADINETNDLYREIQLKGITNSSVVEMLDKRGINYIYIGQRQGTVNYTGPNLLDPNIINKDPNFEVIYHEDRVWIYKLLQ